MNDLLQRVRAERFQHCWGRRFGWVLTGAFVALCAVLFALRTEPALRVLFVLAAAFVAVVWNRVVRLEARVPRTDDDHDGAALLRETLARQQNRIELGQTWWPYAVLSVGFVLWLGLRLGDVSSSRLDQQITTWGALGFVVLTAGAALAQWLGLRRDRRRASALRTVRVEERKAR